MAEYVEARFIIAFDTVGKVLVADVESACEDTIGYPDLESVHD